MAEYVKKDDVIAILRNLSHGTYKGMPVYSAEIDKAITDVYDLESEDVDLDIFCKDCVLRIGHWEVIEIEDELGLREECFCSECGKNTFFESNFCPNCGTKMDLLRKMLHKEIEPSEVLYDERNL